MLDLLLIGISKNCFGRYYYHLTPISVLLPMFCWDLHYLFA